MADRVAKTGRLVENRRRVDPAHLGAVINPAALAALLVFGVLATSLLAADQQAAKSHRIGFLALVPGEDSGLVKTLLERLRELGYIEGRNMTFEYRSAEGRPERLPKLAADLVRARSDVLVAGFGTLAAQAAKAATTTSPSSSRPSATRSAQAWSQASAGPAGTSQA